MGSSLMVGWRAAESRAIRYGSEGFDQSIVQG